jgi:hypothetical protein
VNRKGEGQERKMQQINWFRRIALAVALWGFALGFGTTVAHSLKRALAPDETYRLDCRWVPRSEPLNAFDDPVRKVWGQYYSVAAAGILLVMWALWETLTPKEGRGGVIVIEHKEEPKTTVPPGGGCHP